MKEGSMGPLLVGLAFVIVGALLTLKSGFARWGLQNGRGRIWVRLLGEERALKLTRYFFGPLTILLGLVLTIAELAGLR